MPGDVEGLIRTERNPSTSWHIAYHGLRRLALGGAAGMRRLGVHDQAVAVLHQQVAHIAKPGCLSSGFAVEPGIGVGGGGVCLVAPPLAAEVWTCPALVERHWLIWRHVFRTEPGL